MKEKVLCRLHGQFIDISKFIDSHPGGRGVLEHAAGRDITPMFESNHSPLIRDKQKSLVARMVVPDELVAEMLTDKQKRKFHIFPQYEYTFMQQLQCVVLSRFSVMESWMAYDSCVAVALLGMICIEYLMGEGILLCICRAVGLLAVWYSCLVLHPTHSKFSGYMFFILSFLQLVAPASFSLFQWFCAGVPAGGYWMLAGLSLCRVVVAGSGHVYAHTSRRVMYATHKHKHRTHTPTYT